ncbi:MAG TPA: DUF6084 family protein [Thermoleophilaceae bacterium]|jgi:hypothetical protein
MSVAEPALTTPAPDLWVLDARAVENASAPTLAFELRIRDRSEREVYTIALTAQVMIEPAKRSYETSERERLVELFGDPARFDGVPENLVWARQELLVPSFMGAARFELMLPCGAELELPVVKYFGGVEAGKIPIAFHFTGTVLYRGEQDRLQMVRIPWSASADFQLPLATWRQAVASHYPPGGLVHLREDTVEALRRYRAERGLMTLDDCIAELLR